MPVLLPMRFGGTAQGWAMTETRYEVLHESGALLADFDNRPEAIGWAKAHPRAHRVVERVYEVVEQEEAELWRRKP